MPKSLQEKITAEVANIDCGKRITEIVRTHILKSPQLQRLIVLATKWIPKDHHDWEELQNMGWEIYDMNGKEIL